MHSPQDQLEKLEKKEKIKRGESLYGDRDTIGKIYRDAQMKQKPGETVEAGDLIREMESSLVCDLNDTINSKPYGDRAYYITVHEKKDLAMPRCILRRILTTLYRPFPEDDTLVFHVEFSGQVCFCWCLPHHTEMDNMVANENLYDPMMIKEIKAWQNMNYFIFGFKKDEIGNWIPNEHFKDKPLEERKFDHTSKFIYPIGWDIK